MSSQIKSGAILSYVGLAINILTGLLYTPWMIHSIGKDNFGLYTLAMSVITLFVFDFGLSWAVTRFISKYLAEGRQDKANDCLGLVYRLYIFIDILLFVVLATVYFFIPQIYDSLTPEEIHKFKIVYLIASLFSVISFPFIPLNGVLGANEKFIQYKLCELANKILIVITMSICLVCGYGLTALVLVNAFSGLVMILLKLYCVQKYTKTRINFGYKNKKEQREILGFSGWTTVVSLCQRMIFNIAPSILGIMSGAASIAVLGIAITVEGYTYTFASALNGMFLPKVSRILAGDDKDIMPLMIRVGRIQLMIISAIVFGFICLGREFVHLWVGDQFATSYYCAVLLILPSLLSLPQEIASTAIVADNKIRHQAYVFILMAAVNVGLAFWFAKMWGAVGISLSICIAYFVRTIGMNYLYKKDLQLKLLPFFIKTYIPMIIPMVLTIIVAIVLNNLMAAPSWYLFILKIGVVGIVMIALCWVLFMNRDEKQLVKSLIHLR